MTLKEYELLKQKIETNYRSDVAALDRVWAIERGDVRETVAVSVRPLEPVKVKKLSMSGAMKAAWARRKQREKKNDNEGPVSKKDLQKFLVAEPNGES